MRPSAEPSFAGMDTRTEAEFERALARGVIPGDQASARSVPKTAFLRPSHQCPYMAAIGALAVYYRHRRVKRSTPCACLRCRLRCCWRASIETWMVTVWPIARC